MGEKEKKNKYANVRFYLFAFFGAVSSRKESIFLSLRLLCFSPRNLSCHLGLIVLFPLVWK